MGVVAEESRGLSVEVVACECDGRHAEPCQGEVAQRRIAGMDMVLCDCHAGWMALAERLGFLMECR